MKPLMKYRVTLETGTKNIETWGVFPILNTTKILDGIFNPESKELSLLMDTSTEQYVEVPIQGANGRYKMEQRKMDKYYSLRLQEKDVQFVLDNLVENNFEFESNLIITDVK